ncbi:MAG: hypothetical protein LBT00_10990 [Spirochaetaceae bacterium]|nr:hypothetical protein [Spirochaetaceae bacterium]
MWLHEDIIIVVQQPSLLAIGNDDFKKIRVCSKSPRTGLLRFTRNDGQPARSQYREESCHCETQSGKAIQPEKALALDCFASLAMTGSPLAHNTGRRVVIARRKAAKQSSRRRPSLWISSLHSQ